MDVSIIIVNYNTKDITLNCISSILTNTKNIEYEIIVVDNCSADGSQEILKNKFPEIKLISSPDNLGFGNGNNLGVKEASGDYLFFLNSDTILYDNTILKLYEFYNTYNNQFNLAVLGCKLVDVDLKLINSCGYFPKIFNDILYYPYEVVNRLFKKKYSPYPNYDFSKPYFEVNMVSGADMFIEKEKFLNLGGFDNRFFMYYEETDLQKRFISQGFSNYLITNTSIIHLEGGSVGQVSNAKRIMIQRSRNLYFKLNETRYYFIYLLTEMFVNLVRLFNLNFTLKENLKFIVENIKSI